MAQPEAVPAFQQGDGIRDYVFPICRVEEGNLVGFLGTAFLIGTRGYAITAAHCLSAETGLAAIFVGHDGWYSWGVTEGHEHPTEDIALIRLAGRGWKSIFTVSPAPEHSSRDYSSFGYPEDAYWEVVRNDVAAPRPDLVYTQGYVRRRLTDIPLGHIRGSSFYELSDVAGAGCSGSPIFVRERPRWRVFGVYVGERRTEGGSSVGYAVRSDAFADWQPEGLAHTVSAEALLA